MYSKVKFFSGNSNFALSKKIANSFGMELSSSEISRFSDGEISVFVKENVSGCHCFAIQSVCSPVNDNLMELLIMIDALKRYNARKITAVIPYLGYSRQDRMCRTGEAISARLVADMITSSGADDVIVGDLHSSQIEGFFNIPIVNVSNLENFANDIKNIEGFSPNEFVVVAPDVGAAKKARNFAKFLGCNMAIVDKNRTKVNHSEVMNIIGDVDSKSVVLIDDIVDTAGTITNAAESLLEFGKAKRVYIYATHAVCSGKAFEKLSSDFIEKVVFSDSIPIAKENMTGNIKIVSIADAFAKKIKNFV